MAPNIGGELRPLEAAHRGDSTLGLVRVCDVPHLDHEDLPENTMADEKVGRQPAGAAARD